jgi:hypothetical protein
VQASYLRDEAVEKSRSDPLYHLSHGQRGSGGFGLLPNPQHSPRSKANGLPIRAFTEDECLSPAARSCNNEG